MDEDGFDNVSQSSLHQKSRVIVPKTSNSVSETSSSGVIVDQFSEYLNVRPVSSSWKDLGKSVDTVYEQLENGANVLESLCKMLAKYADVESSYAGELQKAVVKEEERLASKSGEDQLLSVFKCFREISGQLKNVSDVHDTHACETRELVKELRKGVQEYRRRVYQIRDQLKHEQGEIGSMKGHLSKLKTKCNRMLQVMEEPQKNENKLGKLISMAAAAAETHLRNASADPVVRSYQTIRQYEQKVEEVQMIVQRIVQENFSAICVEMEETETLRYFLLRSVCSDLSLGLQLFPGAYSNRSSILQDTCNQMDLQADIERFAQTCSAFDISPRYTVQNELSIKLEDLLVKLSPAQRAELGITEKAPAKISLSQLMNAQRKTIPQLQLPLHLIQLRAALHRVGGFSTEGIFRVSPSSEELDEFIARSATGDYTVPSEDPNIPASAIKRFLRSLNSPIIPVSLYEDCIACESFSELNDKVLLNLDSDSLAVLMYVADICRKVSSHSETKMNFNNLSIVFSPYILSKPAANTNISDMMSASKLEIPLVALLLENITIEPAVISLEEEDLPEGWTICFDQEGNPYYWHGVELKSQWEKPVE